MQHYLFFGDSWLTDCADKHCKSINIISLCVIYSVQFNFICTLGGLLLLRA